MSRKQRSEGRRAMRNDIAAKGYKDVHLTTGVWSEPDETGVVRHSSENGFLVHGMSKEHAIELGSKYKQRAIAHHSPETGVTIHPTPEYKDDSAIRFSHVTYHNAQIPGRTFLKAKRSRGADGRVSGLRVYTGTSFSFSDQGVPVVGAKTGK